jgi:hypothetical protein
VKFQPTAGLVLTLVAATACHPKSGASDASTTSTSDSGSGNGSPDAALSDGAANETDGSTSAGDGGPVDGAPIDAATSTLTVAGLNSLPLTADEQAVLTGLATLATGGSFDLLGNGMPVITTTLTGTSVRTVIVNGANGPLITYTYSINPDRLDISGDLNEDGTIDFTASSVHNADDTQNETFAWDTNFDGTEDFQIIRNFTSASLPLERQLMVLVQTLTGTPAAFQTIAMRSGFARDALGDGICEGQITRPSPSSGDHVIPLPGYPKVRINVNGEPGSCSLDQAARILRALRADIAKELTCLNSVHPDWGEALANSLANTSLDISCGDHCCTPQGCSNANTTVPGSWQQAVWGEQMSLNMMALSSDESLRENLMHELLHFSGIGHPDGPDGDGGHDGVYSCGRYCDGCTHDTLGAGMDMQDCLSCASDLAHKAKCGSTYQEVQQPANDAAICHGGIGENAACNRWVVQEVMTCTGEVLNQGAPCCAECPPPDTRSNDFPCMLPSPPPPNHCTPTSEPAGCSAH